MSRISIINEIEYDDDLFEGSVPNFDFGYTYGSTSNVVVDLVSVPANSTDLSLSVSTIANTKRVILCDLESSDELSIKVNGDSVAFPLGNRFKMSDALTSLSATNTSTTTARRIYIVYITEV